MLKSTSKFALVVVFFQLLTFPSYAVLSETVATKNAVEKSRKENLRKEKILMKKAKALRDRCKVQKCGKKEKQEYSKIINAARKFLAQAENDKSASEDLNLTIMNMMIQEKPGESLNYGGDLDTDIVNDFINPPGD